MFSTRDRRCATLTVCGRWEVETTAATPTTDRACVAVPEPEPEPEPATRSQFEDRCVMSQFEPAPATRTVPAVLFETIMECDEGWHGCEHVNSEVGFDIDVNITTSLNNIA